MDAPVSQAYPPADISPSEFEQWIAEVLGSAAPSVDDLRITTHERVQGTDGSFDLDATARFSWFGMDFVVVVEAKRHAHSIKRDLVQVLHSKVQSVGAHKGVMFSTSGYQRGAIAFADRHKIALVTVTEGRFTYFARAESVPALTREEARELLGTPTFVGFWQQGGDDPGSIRATLISTQHPEYIRVLLGLATD